MKNALLLTGALLSGCFFVSLQALTPEEEDSLEALITAAPPAAEVPVTPADILPPAGIVPAAPVDINEGPQLLAILANQTPALSLEVDSFARIPKSADNIITGGESLQFRCQATALRNLFIIPSQEAFILGPNTLKVTSLTLPSDTALIAWGNLRIQKPLATSTTADTPTYLPQIIESLHTDYPSASFDETSIKTELKGTTVRWHTKLKTTENVTWTNAKVMLTSGTQILVEGHASRGGTPYQWASEPHHGWDVELDSCTLLGQ